MSFFPYYEKLSTKQEVKLTKSIQQIGHTVDLLNILSESFVHNFEELEKLPTGIIEQYLNTYGVCGVCEDEKGKIVIGVADLMSTSYYNYQKGDNVNITMIGSNRVFNKKVGVDCELIFNNSTRTPTIDVMTFSNLLTEIDVSLDKIIKMTRYIKVPVVNNEKEKTQIEEIFSSIESGNLKAVTSMKNDIEKLVSAYTDTSDNDIKTIELTDVGKSNNIQYLTLLRNSIKEFFYTKYGHSIRNTAKVAQQSKDEVNDLSVTSLILPFNMLKNRKQGWERVNALFGTNYTCEFSELINIEIMKTEESEEPEKPEEPEETEEPEEPTEPEKEENNNEFST